MTGIRRASAFILAWTVFVAGCSDRDPAGTGPAVAEIELTPMGGTLQLGDSTQLTARALSSAGQALAGRTITWSTNNPSILRVSNRGVVVGLAPGQAMVTASSGGRSASAVMDVHSWNIATSALVIDSTELRLSGDAGERAAGLYRFEVISSAAPELSPGRIIVGAEKGGFLRRVVTVAREGGVVVVETEPSSLSAIVRAGGFSTSTSLLSGAGMTPAQLAAAIAADVPGRVLWGEGRFESLADGLTAQAGGFNLADIDVCAMVAASGSGATCPAGLDTLQILDGVLTFDPDFLIEAEFAASRLTRFRGVLTGPLGLDVGLHAGASAPYGRYEAQANLFTFTRPFISAIGPVPVTGHVRLSVDLRLEVAQSASGAMETALESQSTVLVGAEWAGSWNLIEGSSGTFTAHQPALAPGTLSKQTELFAKVVLVPRAQVVMYGTPGPFAEVQPFNTATVSRGSACTVTGTTGMNAAVGFSIPFLDPTVGSLTHAWSPAVEGPATDWPCPVGELRVTVSTTGQDVDPEGFSAVLDGVPSIPVAANGQVTFDLVEAGDRVLRLDGVAPNCTVQGGSERAVTVQAGATATVAFEVTCVEMSGDLEVTTTTSGAAPDPDGFTVAIDGGTPQPMGINDRVSFPGLKPGQKSVELLDVAANCTVTGTNPRVVNVPGNGVASETFEITCAATGIDVHVTVAGVPAAGGDWQLVLNDDVTRAIQGAAEEFFSVTAGTHEVALQGLPHNCQLQGSSPRSVTVAAGRTANVTFAVECATGTLSVSVSTEGNPWPVGNYTIVAAGRSLSVGLNGSVDFADMPAGPVEVRIDGTPSHCTVQGSTQQMVTVPGTVTFEVVCEPPAACAAPPAVDWRTDIQRVPGQGGTWSADILLSQWNRMSATASSAAGSGAVSGSQIRISMGGADYIHLLPVDGSRAGEPVTLHIEVSGRIEITGNGSDVQAYSLLRYHGQADGFFHERRFTVHDGSTTGEPGVFSAAAVVGVPAVLSDWSELRSELHIEVGPGSNSSASSVTSELRVHRLVEVRDAAGNVVPITAVCTSSRTAY